MEKNKTEENKVPGACGLPVTAIELTERDEEKNRYSNIRLAFDAWRTRTGAMTSRVTYTRRYDLDAEFDSVSNYFQIPDTVVSGCRAFISEKLLGKYPAGRASKKPSTYAEIRVFSGQKVISRVMRGDSTKELFEELERLLKRTLS